MSKKRTRPSAKSKVWRDAWIMHRLIARAMQDPEGEAAKRLRRSAEEATAPEPIRRTAGGAVIWDLPLLGVDDRVGMVAERMTKAEKRAEFRSILETHLRHNDAEESWRSAVAAFDEWSYAYLEDRLWPEEDFARGHEGQFAHLRFLACIVLALPSDIAQPHRALALRVLHANAPSSTDDEKALREALATSWPRALTKSATLARDLSGWFVRRAAEALDEDAASWTAAKRKCDSRKRHSTSG